MNLTLAEFEALCLFLAQRKPMWDAHCLDMAVDPDEIARELARAHAERVRAL